MEKKELGINAALALALCAWSVLHPSPGLQPMTVAMVVFFFRVNAKLVALLPSPEDRDAKVQHEAKRMMRTIGLVLGALSAGILLSVGLPTLVASIGNLALPGWLFTRQELLVNLSTVLGMALIASYYR